MDAPWHHIRARKKHLHLSEATKITRFIDVVIYFVAIAAPLMTIPQVWEVWINKNVNGVSLATWVAYLSGSIFWLIYGVIHREKPIICTQILWISFQAMVVIGLFLYS